MLFLHGYTGEHSPAPQSELGEGCASDPVPCLTSEIFHGSRVRQSYTKDIAQAVASVGPGYKVFRKFWSSWDISCNYVFKNIVITSKKKVKKKKTNRSQI